MALSSSADFLHRTARSITNISLNCRMLSAMASSIASDSIVTHRTARSVMRP